MRSLILIMLLFSIGCRAHVRMVEMNYNVETGAHESGTVTYASEIDRAPGLAIEKAKEWCAPLTMHVESEVRPTVSVQRHSPVIPVGRGAVMINRGATNAISKLTYLTFRCK